jgi:outer membrane protein TolC
MLRLYEKMGSRLKGHSEIARAKEKVGLATPMDTYRAEIPLKEAEDAMITASAAFQDAKDRLKLILALPQNTELEGIAPEAPDFRELSLDDAIETALKKRIEIEQMNYDMAEAERKAALMKHNILPELNLVVGYGRYSVAETMGQSTRFDLDRYSASLQAGTDIFRTAEKAAYQQSLINIKTLRLNMESRMDDISRQVRKQWLSLKEAAKRMEIRKSQIKQGEEKIALAEVKFAHGMADNFDVIEAEKELQSARGNLLAAEIEYAGGIYNMKAIMGELVPRN